MSVRTIHPARASGRMRAPPSKSYTHRALVAAFLARRATEVRDPLDSDDTGATRLGLEYLGARIRRSRSGWAVSSGPGAAGPPRGPIQCRESGTTLRLLVAVAALGSAPVAFEGAARLSVRPMAELFRALRQLGAEVHSSGRARALPCTIQGPLRPGRATLRGDVSSQFTSSLLMVLPTLSGSSTLRIRGTEVSRPYVDATCAMLSDRGVRVHRTPHGYRIPGHQRYRGGRIPVPGDASSAAYLWASAAATNGDVAVEGVPATWPQADRQILPILSEMGAHVRISASSARVSGSLVRPVTWDLTDAPDLYPLVSVLAALVPGGRSRLSGAPQLKFKESDRRRQSVRLARAVGARVTENGSRIEVVGTETPRPLHLLSLSDHRLVMSAAVAALAGPAPSRVGRAEAVSKSYPGFWSALEELSHPAEPLV